MTATRTRRRGLKTWSSFGNLGRRPTEYEIVTHNLNHTTGSVPLQLGEDVNGNRWLIEHRDGSALTVPEWDAFRDPDGVTYGSYVAGQDDQETYVENLMERYDSEGHDEALSGTALDYLAGAYTPTRYLAHGQQMLSAYVQQLAPSSYVATCAAFQTADQLRRVQLVSCRTVALQRTHEDRGFGTGERSLWEKDPQWTVVREAIEKALVEFDMDRSLVATQLVLKPILDLAFLRESVVELSAVGAVLDALIVENLGRDAERSRRWTGALLEFLNAADEGNAAVLQSVLDEWGPHGHAVVDAAAEIVAGAGNRSATEIAEAVRSSWSELLAPAGLTANQG